MHWAKQDVIQINLTFFYYFNVKFKITRAVAEFYWI